MMPALPPTRRPGPLSDLYERIGGYRGEPLSSS
jgi:hypothetical protein